MKNLIQKWNSINLIKRIICGLIVGIILGLAIPQASVISILGDLFVGALRGIAPLLVFFLVMSSLCHMGKGQKTNMKFVVVLYLLGNILSALAAVISSRLFPIMLTFSESTNTSDVTPPSGVAEVLKNLLLSCCRLLILLFACGTPSPERCTTVSAWFPGWFSRLDL